MQHAVIMMDVQHNVLRGKMNCTISFVSWFCKIPSLTWAAWHKAGGLVYQWNSEKLPNFTAQFILSLWQTCGTPYCLGSARAPADFQLGWRQHQTLLQPYPATSHPLALLFPLSHILPLSPRVIKKPFWGGTEGWNPFLWIQNRQEAAAIPCKDCVKVSN